jgi:small neutral amino acid transporter SnatA (MarC family)
MIGAPSLLVTVFAGLAAGNPARRVAGLVRGALAGGDAPDDPERRRPGRPEGAAPGVAESMAGVPAAARWRRVLLVAVLVTAVPLVVVVLTAGPILDALDVGPPTVRIAAGLVLTAAALVQLLRGRRRGPPIVAASEVTGGAALVPLAFPYLLRPELALVALSAGADRGWVGLLPVAVGLGPLALVARRLPSSRGRGLLAAAGSFTAALGVLVGVDFVVRGVFAL